MHHNKINDAENKALLFYKWRTLAMREQEKKEVLGQLKLGQFLEKTHAQVEEMETGSPLVPVYPLDNFTTSDGWIPTPQCENLHSTLRLFLEETMGYQIFHYSCWNCELFDVSQMENRMRSLRGQMRLAP